LLSVPRAARILPPAFRTAAFGQNGNGLTHFS
jgi:hypothetical protein